jgi:hypothetical protein
MVPDTERLIEEVVVGVLGQELATGVPVNVYMADILFRLDELIILETVLDTEFVYVRIADVAIGLSDTV